jgi:hypothetical protein
MTTNNTCKKCGCQDSFMPSPAPCPSPVACPTPQPCSEIFDARCVRYTGLPLSCTVVNQAFGADNAGPTPGPAPAGPIVNTNDTVAEALEGIVDYICNNSGEGSMTSTITCGIQDYPATVIVNSGTSYNDAIVAVSNYYCDQINNILDNPPAPEYTYEIGQYVASRGGVIFHRYKDGTNENYLVVDTTDLSTNSAWSNVTSLIGSTAQSTWDGLSNSNAIVAQVGFTSGAAKLCLDSANNGQTDWYLPAMDELSLLLQNRFNINKTLSNGLIVGATPLLVFSDYWTSTETASSTAWAFYFTGVATSGTQTKSNSGYEVRAIRKFTI